MYEANRPANVETCCVIIRERILHSNFQRNLRLLTNHYKSVAEVCRQLGINRSQFNKYLSGRATPSRHTLQTICDFFGVEEYEIQLPNGDFRKIVNLKPSRQSAVGSSRPYIAYLDQLVRRSRSDLVNYEGYYFEYTYSMTRPGLILRSLLNIVGEAGTMTYQRIENIARIDRPEPRIKCKYQGMAFYLNDRIFLIDYDSLTGNEISQTVLYPNYQHRLTRLSGLKLGVSTGSRREPLCARVVLEALGRQVSVKKALYRCGLFEPGSPEIEPEIEDTITYASPEGTHHFRVNAE